MNLKPCPMCGCTAVFEYGAPMTSGQRIVKARCSIGCVAQVIFHCNEADAATAWNSRPGSDRAGTSSTTHIPGWERGIATVTMTGHQLREALEFINPDGGDDPDQMDDDLTFGIVQHKDDDGKIATGLCCWNSDTDGVLPLDGDPPPA